MLKKLQRINESDYQKTGNEMQDKLTNDDIDLLLEEYDEVTNILDLKVGTHVRYFTLIKKKKGVIKKLFRLGGNVIKIDHEAKYAVLSNNKVTWCVQFDNTIFYKKMSISDVKEFYELELDAKDSNISKYKKQMSEMKTDINMLVESNNQILNENTKCKNKIMTLKTNMKTLAKEHEQSTTENVKLKSEIKRIKKFLKKSGMV